MKKSAVILFFNSLNNMKLVHIWNDNNRIESLSNLYIEFRYRRN